MRLARAAARRARRAVRLLAPPGQHVRAVLPAAPQPTGRVELGPAVDLDPTAVLVAAPAAVIQIGESCHLGAQVRIECAERIVLGRNVQIGAHAAVVDTWRSTGTIPPSPDTEIATAPPPPPGGPVRLGDGVIVGPLAIVGPGVTVGAGATIAPGAVVLDDVAAGTAVTGNPATPATSATTGGS